MPTSVLPSRAAALAAGVTVALTLTLTPLPSHAQPLREPIDRQISVAEEQLEIVIEDYNDLREEIRANLRRAEELGAELAELDQTVRQHRGELGVMMATAYRAGNAQALMTMSALVDGTSTEGLVDSLMLITRLSRDQQRTIQLLAESRERLTDARQAARQLADRLHGQERQLAARKNQIENDLARLTRLRDSAGYTGRSPAGLNVRPPKLPPGAAANAVQFAFAQLNKPYQWGGSGPNGFDCSGLTSAAWATGGIRLPHNAARQWGVVNRVSRAHLRPGDLVFYYRDLHHVAIYVGDDRIIHAPRPGQRVSLDHVAFQPIHSFGRPG